MLLQQGVLSGGGFGRSLPEWLDLPDPKGFRPKRRFRTVWISDIHLGTRGCNATMLVDFLRSVECETLYLVGDIIDGWRLKKGWFWPDAHNEVLRRVLKKAHRGTRVVFVCGNHDEMLRPYAGLSFGGVELVLETIHTTADGRRLLVTHGDSFDAVVLYHRWLAVLGDHAYELMMRLNIVFNVVRRAFKLPYWSLSAYLKKRVKNAVSYICSYEEAVAHEAITRGLDGIVFTGGIGENSPAIRAAIAVRMGWLGLTLDEAANRAGAVNINIAGSAALAWAIPTDEEAVIAHHTRALAG